MLALLIPSAARAQRNRLTTPDYLLWASSSALLVADWGQTHDALARGRYELSLMLGKHPSASVINAYFVSALGANALVTRIRDREWRRVLWAVLLGAELATVSRNRRVGVGWRMRF